MIFRYRTTIAAIMASLFLLSCPVMASGGGGGTSEEDNSNTMTYITIGLAVVIGGLLFLDVITSSDEETVPADPLINGIIDTGVNWDEAFPSDTFLITIAVSVFSGENGSETAMQFINVLDEVAGDNIVTYHDPVDLGTGSAVHRAAMAHEFFGADYLIFQVEDPETRLYGIASPDSVLWTSTNQYDNNIVVVVEELLQFVVSYRTDPELY